MYGSDIFLLCIWNISNCWMSTPVPPNYSVSETGLPPCLYQVKRDQLSSTKGLIGVRFLTLSCYLMKEIELISSAVFKKKLRCWTLSKISVKKIVVHHCQKLQTYLRSFVIITLAKYSDSIFVWGRVLASLWMCSTLTVIFFMTEYGMLQQTLFAISCWRMAVYIGWLQLILSQPAVHCTLHRKFAFCHHYLPC